MTGSVPCSLHGFLMGSFLEGRKLQSVLSSSSRSGLSLDFMDAQEPREADELGRGALCALCGLL